MSKKIETLLEQYQGKCWEWPGNTGKGYGLVKRRGQQTRAHRVSYEAFRGVIPKGLSVLHQCDNALCCNPFHLYAGTQRNNVADRVNRGRGAHGSRIPQSVLSEACIPHIRARYAEGWTQKALAKHYGVGQSTISLVVRRVTWRHV